MSPQDPPAMLTTWHDDGTVCEHGFLRAVQRGPEPPWCAGGQQLTRIQVDPHPDTPEAPP